MRIYLGPSACGSLIASAPDQSTLMDGYLQGLIGNQRPASEDVVNSGPQGRTRRVQLRTRWTSAAHRLGRNVCQPDRILADQVTGHQTERRPGAGEEWLAAPKHDGMEVES